VPLPVPARKVARPRDPSWLGCISQARYEDPRFVARGDRSMVDGLTARAADATASAAPYCS